MVRSSNSIIKDLDIDKIITKLKKAYADEWLAYYLYFIEKKPSKHNERCSYYRIHCRYKKQNH
jgi:ferritin-like protein